MPYILAITIGTIIGLLAKGKISNYFEVKLEKAWIFITAFVCLTIFQILAGKYEFVSNYSIVIQGLAYFLILIGVWFNKKYVGICIIGLGCVSNALVILMNNGKMPVSADAIKRAGIVLNSSNIDIKHSIFVIGDKTKMPFLADIFNLQGWIGLLMRIVSIGDLIIIFGLFLVALQIVTGWKLKKNNC